MCSFIVLMSLVLILIFNVENKSNKRKHWIRRRKPLTGTVYICIHMQECIKGLPRFFQWGPNTGKGPGHTLKVTYWHINTVCISYWHIMWKTLHSVGAMMLYIWIEGWLTGQEKVWWLRHKRFHRDGYQSFWFLVWFCSRNVTGTT